MATTVWVKSGLTSLQPSQIDFTASNENFELTFPTDLKTVISKYKDYFAITALYDKLVSTPADPNCIMIECIGTEYQPEQGTRTVTFRIWIFKPRSDQDTGQNSFSAAYTVHRILRLLTANKNFDGFAGINRVENLSALCGSAFSENFTEMESYLDGGSIDITYNLIDTSLQQAD